MKLPGKGLSWKQFAKDLKREYTRDNIGDAAAALTFWAVLALFPFLLCLVALASLIISPEDAQVLVDQLGQVAPAQVTEILGGRLQKLGQESQGGLLTLGLLGALWSASGAINALTRALNTAYDVEDERPFWKARGLAILMTVFAAVFAVLAAVVAVALPPVANAIGGPVGTALVWLRLPLAALLMMLLWAVLYWALPNVEQKFRFISPGAIVGVVIWVIASWAFSVYVQNFGSYDATYGALGGIIVLLLWMWISSQVVLIGAEINAIIEHRSPEGKRAGAKSAEDTGESRPKGARRERPRLRPVRTEERPPDERLH